MAAKGAGAGMAVVWCSTMASCDAVVYCSALGMAAGAAGRADGPAYGTMGPATAASATVAVGALAAAAAVAAIVTTTPQADGSTLFQGAAEGEGGEVSEDGR